MIRITRHGPVISDLASNDQAPTGQVMALQATFLADDDRSVEAQWRATQAHNWPAWVEEFRHFTAPMQNMVYADRDGNIGFFCTGPRANARSWRRTRTGARLDGRVRLGCLGWTSSSCRRPLIPRPVILRHANDKIVSDDYPYLITHDWDYALYRIETNRDRAYRKPTLSNRLKAQLRCNSRRYRLTLAKRLLPLMLCELNRVTREPSWSLTCWRSGIANVSRSAGAA